MPNGQSPERGIGAMSVTQKTSRLRSRADRLHRGVGRIAVRGNEEIMVVHVAIHVSGNFRGLGTKGGTPALQEDDHHDAPNAGVGVGSEPAEARSGVRTGSGFAQNLFFVEVQSQFTGSTVLDGPGHAIGKLRNEGSDVELATSSGVVGCCR